MSNENNANKEAEEDSDFHDYLKEMEMLEEDFSDLDDLNFEEIQEMREAIELVKKEENVEGELIEEPSTEVSEENNPQFELLSESGQSQMKESNERELIEQYKRHQDTESFNKASMEETSKEPISSKEPGESSMITKSGLENEEGDLVPNQDELLTDFSDLGKMDLNELLEMKKAVESVKQEKSDFREEGSSTDQEPESMESELEKRLQEELEKKKQEKKKEKEETEESFLEYIKDRKDKIWYHALNYLVYEVEDHVASKNLLYDELKEVTSKSPIDPIPEHQFYFGLGYLLRLTFKGTQVVRYQSGGKFKVNMNIEKLKSLLEQAGDPMSTRPVIKDEKKKRMFIDFLKDDFSDI
ncbi:MAG: hypothetical protein BAJALOKI2v1_30011 [Promethearchaeota archaeon]|nr:MAG: hypothetical protein BAJALOKI2v1_30011 [Candidatus Lokiarchaeota archaeon]